MTADRTQQQSDHQQQHSRQLSQQRAQPPLVVPGYETRQFLGAGAYGEVWVAVDQKTGRRVAIKFYTQSSSVDWSHLSREVEKLVFLSADRYVVQLLDVGWDADPLYYVMEYVEGGSLQQVLDQKGSLRTGEAVEMFREVATGLLHAHGKGVLHCDLKPANILLDQDGKPRLADFGQSRLSHEQTPALGTLFFMAPEQADLTAVPDARWDVYALGALLYCLLTGAPPHRTDSLVSQIDSAPTLSSRLERYREEILAAPAPTGHRQISNVDRELADLIDRCLHVDPERRFPNVQSVITALRNRDATRDRRPLLMLGLLGPLLFLLVLGLYSWSTARLSVQDADQVLKTWALESSRFAAKYVSEAVARRIDGYFRQVQEQAASDAVQEVMSGILADEDLSRLLADLTETRAPAAGKRARERLAEHPLCRQLQRRMDDLMAKSRDNVASWFVTDAQGVQLAAAFSDSVERSVVGIDFSWRTYFHGGPEDLREGVHHGLAPLRGTQLSTVFQSRATGTWKVAVSTPIVAAGRTLGVVALTLELGRLGDEQAFADGEARFVVLVDGRRGPSNGTILQHPLFNEILSRNKSLPDDINNYRVPLSELPTADAPVTDVTLYRDPLAGIPDVPEARDFDRKWIAASAAVRLGSPGSASALDTGLVVMVQEDYDLAAQPVEQLGRDVRHYGLLALLMILIVGVFLWYLVTRALRDPNEALRRSGVPTTRPSSLQSMETLELPRKLRDARRQSDTS